MAAKFQYETPVFMARGLISPVRGRLLLSARYD